MDLICFSLFIVDLFREALGQILISMFSLRSINYITFKISFSLKDYKLNLKNILIYFSDNTLRKKIIFINELKSEKS